MARYDVYPTRSDRETPYLLDVQTNILSGFNTRVVVPLVRLSTFKPNPRLHPVFSVRGQPVIMATHLIGAVPLTELGEPIATLEDAHFMIVNALDMLFSGY